ncbi:mitochondrial ribonuclease P catalytic subunit-like isoform X2 [Daphnia carinata]|uniref:mitochondrial ribonuclease P catalytic subunit-like isoform X2 n=1 Tax=Daphnia carinata TaxID=120202 RepID=UPI002579C810|nr:mitochondrial ribonuclease P catalytic subunit-like isoform X2 [Daphnia carinata]
MNRTLLSKFLALRRSGTFHVKSAYATFNNRKALNESAPKLLNQHAPHVNQFESEMEQFIKTTHSLTGIHQFQENLISKHKSKLLTKESFDAIFMRMCLACRNYQLGKQFLLHIDQTGRQANTATLAKFLSLCYFCSAEVEDKSEIEKLCSVLKSHGEYLDAATKESIILGLSITDSWQKGLKLLEEDETAQFSLAMNAMVDCLLSHNHFDTAVSWMEKMIAKERPISDFVYEHWLRKCAAHHECWEIFSDFLARSGVFLKQPIVQQLEEVLRNRSRDPFVGQFTAIDEDTGRCGSCQKVLQNTDITDEEFAALRKRITEKVLLGTDVFLGSKPEEIQRFKELIKTTAPYDIVIDGLNVAYHMSSKNRKQPSAKVDALVSVVKHFTNQKLRVLVLTRKHLLTGVALQRMKQEAHVFITENLVNTQSLSRTISSGTISSAWPIFDYKQFSDCGSVGHKYK